MAGANRSAASSRSLTSGRRQLFALLTVVTVSFGFIAGLGCDRSHKRSQVDLGKIYDTAAQLPDNYRNPVIVVPGILGSRLVNSENGQSVWGELSRKASNPRRVENLQALALPMASGVPLDQLRDSIREDGPLDELTIKLLGVPIRVNAYAQILAALGVGGYRDQHFRGESALNEVDYDDDHFTCFQYSYDWRRDIAETAADLDRFIIEQEKIIREKYREKFGIENPEIKFDVVAHSMGGLVARYYLRYGNQPLPADGSLPELNWAGARHIGRLVLVGTPNAGSSDSIVELVEGKKLLNPFSKVPPVVIGTMPSTYQLLPRTRHQPLVTPAGETIDVYDPAVWEKLSWGLADPKQDKQLKKLLPEVDDAETRRAIALDHQRKCLARAKQFSESLDFDAVPPPGLELHLYAGDARPTLHQIVIDGETGKFKDEVETAGDGTVTRSSAVMQEAASPLPYDAIPWTNKTFISSSHLGLTRDRVFVDNVLSLLLEQVEPTQ